MPLCFLDSAHCLKMTSALADLLLPRYEVTQECEAAPRDLAQTPGVADCRLPEDCIDPRKYPLLAAREAMRQLVDVPVSQRRGK